jgi:hypothetical protein
MHPADLLDVLQSGGKLLAVESRAGWPDRYYVQSKDAPGFELWTSRHLCDYGYDMEALQALLAALTDATDVRWFFTRDAGVQWEPKRKPTEL